MNLKNVYRLLLAADGQKSGEILKVSDPQEDYDVREMTAAGLIEATLRDGHPESFTSVNRVTEKGQAFLRTFKDNPISLLSIVPSSLGPADERQPETGAVLEKWRTSLSTDLGGLPQGS